MGKLDDSKYAFTHMARKLDKYATMEPTRLPSRFAIEQELFPFEQYSGPGHLRNDGPSREFFRDLFENTYTHVGPWWGIDVTGFRREPVEEGADLTYYFFEVKGINVIDKPRSQRNRNFRFPAYQITGEHGLRNQLRLVRNTMPRIIGENGTRATVRHAYGGVIFMLCYNPQEGKEQREYEVYATMPVMAVGLNERFVKITKPKKYPRVAIQDRYLEDVLDDGRLIDITSEINCPQVRRFAISPRIHLPRISTPEYRMRMRQQEEDTDDLRNEGWSGEELPFNSTIDDTADEAPF